MSDAPHPRPTPAAALPPGGGAGRLGAWPPLLIALVCAAVFARALGGALVYDDLLLVGRNPDIGSLANLPRFFARPYWAFLDPSSNVGYWRPLSATALALGHALGGGAPWGFHAIAIAAHAVAACAACRFAWRVARSRWVATFAGLLFAVHPLQVEGVAWISAVNDPLSVAAVLLAAGAWLGWRQAGSRGLPLAALGWLAVGLLTKESALVALSLFLLVDLCTRPLGAPEPPPQAASRGWGGALAVVALWVGARVLVFRSVWAGFDLVAAHLGVGAGRLALLRLELFGGALELLAWPFRLTLFRPFRPHVGSSDPRVLLAAGATVAWALALLVAWRRRRPRVVFALALVPASLAVLLVRVESLGIFPLSDRFLSLAVLSPALALPLLLRRAPRGLATGLCVALVALWATASVLRIGVWRDEETLFRDALAKAPESPYVHWGLGRILLDRYLREGDPDALNEAERVFLAGQDLLLRSREPGTEVLAGPTDFVQTNLGYGWARLLQDERSGFRGSAVALRIFQELAERIRAVEEQRVDARALGNFVEDVPLELEQVETAIGVTLARSGRDEEAERAFLRALERNPRYPEAHQNLGRLYAARGDWTLAARHFERARELRPGEPEDRLLVAQAWAELGRYDDAEALARSLGDELHGPEPLLLEAQIAIGERRADDALLFATRAAELAPENARAPYLRAQALLLSDDPAAAEAPLRRAAELDPASFDAAYDLGVLLSRLGRAEEAGAELARAYSLCRDVDLRARLREALLGLSGLSPDTLLELAFTDARRQDNEASLAWLDRLLAKAPEHPDALLQRGRLLRRLGRHPEAIASMRRACAAAPGSFPAHSELGVYLAERGDVQGAITELEQARTIGPPPAWPPEIAREARAELDRRLEALRRPGDGEDGEDGEG